MHSIFLHIQRFFFSLFNVWRKRKNFGILGVEELIDSPQTFEMNLNYGSENYKEQYFENVSWVNFSINYGFSLIIIFKILSLILGPPMSSSSRRRQQACEACKIIAGGVGLALFTLWWNKVKLAKLLVVGRSFFFPFHLHFRVISIVSIC